MLCLFSPMVGFSFDVQCELEKKKKKKKTRGITTGSRKSRPSTFDWGGYDFKITRNSVVLRN
jgi:hypothetical protein